MLSQKCGYSDQARWQTEGMREEMLCASPSRGQVKGHTQVRMLLPVSECLFSSGWGTTAEILFLGAKHMWPIKANISFLIPPIPSKEQVPKTMAIFSNLTSSPTVTIIPKQGWNSSRDSGQSVAKIPAFPVSEFCLLSAYLWSDQHKCIRRSLSSLSFLFPNHSCGTTTINNKMSPLWA